MELSLGYIKRLTSSNEGVDVEFKETTGQLSRGMETLCGMLNSNGGIVVFGISNNGKIIGQDIADKTTREIGEALNKFDPAIDIQPVYFRIDDSDKSIIVFHADGLDTDKPYMWNGKPYQRHDSVTSVMPREKFIRLHELQHGLKYKWENEINQRLSVNDLDEQLILNIIQSAVRRGRLSSAALNDNVLTTLDRLKLVKGSYICNSAAVLFGKDFTDYPQCKLRLARFKGFTNQDFVDNQQCEGNIFQLADAAMAFFFKHLNLGGTTHNRIHREDELEIPYDALREAVVNAFCHMNWGYEIATVGIAIYDDRIEIENAGHFPAKISPNALMLEEEKDRMNTSLPPNPVIANVMYLGGLIEHWGRGLSLMARECERVGLPTPRFSCGNNVVRTIFTRPNDTNKPQTGHSRDTAGHSKATADKATLKLIEHIGEDWLTANALCSILGLKSKSSFIRNHIQPAIKAGLVTSENPGKPNVPDQRYGLTIKGKAIYYDCKKSDKESVYDLQNDPQTNFEGQNDPQISEHDPQKTTIIRAIMKNNSISRAELAKIASCSESTIKRRLKEWKIAWLGHPKTGHWVYIRDIE